MNLFFKSFGLLVLTLSCQIAFAEGRDNKHEKVRYVQGGACAPGRGTKKHPYISLDQAYQHTTEWDVLVVLSSTTPLDGGITLNDGQKLIGEENPTTVGLSPTQPTITNTTLNNGGNGAVVNGNVVIENIHFSNLDGSGIQYNNAQDLTIKNVLITDYRVAGLRGVCTNSGVTDIRNLIIRDNGGTAIEEELLAPGIHRELSICTSNLSLTGGVRVFIDNPDNISLVSIKDSYFALRNSGFGIAFINRGRLSALIKDSSFHDTFNTGIFSSSSGSRAESWLEVEGCLFEQGEFGVRISDTGSSTELAVENSVINLGSSAFRSNLFDVTDSSTQNICLRDNKVTAPIFYIARNNSDSRSGRTDVFIDDNFFTGAKAIQIDASTPWNSLTIDAEHNCFMGDSTAAALLSQGGPAGSAIIYAHQNSFSGFVPDIKDLGADLFYEVTDNWWGHAVPVACMPGSCVFAQTCTNGFCQGPVVVGTTKVLANDPLPASIQCPHNCCQRLPVAQP